MDTISLQTVLEMMSDEIWRELIPERSSETGTGIPSLSERQQVVSTLLPKASFDGMTVRFDAEHSTLTEIPFFNYLILDDDPVFTDFPDGSSRMTANSWSIFCFSSFDEMSEYIQQQELMCFIVYVRDNSRYRKAQHRFAVQRPGSEKIYLNEWGFHYPDADLADTYDRSPTYRYYFEIVGLCEIHCEDEISTCIISSLDDLVDELGGRASDEAMQWVGDLVRVTGSPYHETGTVHYDGSLYTYCIEIKKDSIMWFFSNERKEPYCSFLHSFCTPEAKCCDEKILEH